MDKYRITSHSLLFLLIIIIDNRIPRKRIVFTVLRTQWATHFTPFIRLIEFLTLYLQLDCVFARFFMLV